MTTHFVVNVAFSQKVIGPVNVFQDIPHRDDIVFKRGVQIKKIYMLHRKLKIVHAVLVRLLSDLNASYLIAQFFSSQHKMPPARAKIKETAAFCKLLYKPKTQFVSLNLHPIVS